MSSVNWLKVSSPYEVKAILRHCDKEERVKYGHSNEYINKENTKYNSQLDISYEEACKDFDKEMEKCQSLSDKRIRKDAVRCVFLDIPIPEGIEDTDNANWFKDCLDTVSDTCGGHLIQAYVHRDEHHEYTGDDNKKHMSRDHMHIAIIPEVEDGKLLCKEFSSRKNIIKLNSTIEQMTQDKYGCCFNTGEKKKGKSVEELKTESSYREINNELNNRQFELDRREIILDMRESDLKESKEQSKKIGYNEGIEQAKQDSYAIIKQAKSEASDLILRCKETLENIKTIEKNSDDLYNDLQGYITGFNKLKNRFKEGSQERKFIDKCINQNDKLGYYRDSLKRQTEELYESVNSYSDSSDFEDEF